MRYSRASGRGGYDCSCLSHKHAPVSHLSLSLAVITHGNNKRGKKILIALRAIRPCQYLLKRFHFCDTWLSSPLKSGNIYFWLIICRNGKKKTNGTIKSNYFKEWYFVEMEIFWIEWEKNSNRGWAKWGQKATKWNDAVRWNKKEQIPPKTRKRGRIRLLFNLEKNTSAINGVELYIMEISCHLVSEI